MKTFDYNGFSKNLGRLINEKNIRVKDVADQLGVTPQAVYKWMNGDAFPDYEKLVGLTDVLGVSLEDIFPIIELDWSPAR